MPTYLDTPTLVDLAYAAELRSKPPCMCTKTLLNGWESQPISLDESRFREIGTLREHNDTEPTFEEFLPGNVNYWSADAPIAPQYYPYNRCSVWHCELCGRLYLRYTEGGGYFVDRRIRALQSRLITDVSS